MPVLSVWMAESPIKPSIVLSRSRRVSEFHFCLHDLHLVHPLPIFAYDASLLYHFQSSVGDVALVSHDLTRCGILFLLSIFSCGTVYVFCTFCHTTFTNVAVSPGHNEQPHLCPSTMNDPRSCLCRIAYSSRFDWASFSSWL